MRNNVLVVAKSIIEKVLDLFEPGLEGIEKVLDGKVGKKRVELFANDFGCGTI